VLQIVDGEEKLVFENTSKQTFFVEELMDCSKIIDNEPNFTQGIEYGFTIYRQQPKNKVEGPLPEDENLFKNSKQVELIKSIKKYKKDIFKKDGGNKLRVICNTWLKHTKMNGENYKYLGEYDYTAVSSDGKKGFVPDGRGVMYKTDAGQRQLYVGFFERGLLNGVAWEVPFNAYENGNLALMDWSFENDGKDRSV